MKLKGLRGLSLAVLTLIPLMGGWAFAQPESAERGVVGASRQRLDGTVVGIDSEKGTLAVKGTEGEAPISVQVDEKTRFIVMGGHGVLSASLKELLMGAQVRLVTSPSSQGPPLAVTISVLGKKEKDKPQQSQPVSGQKGQRP